jgi:hypothetical protein
MRLALRHGSCLLQVVLLLHCQLHNVLQGVREQRQGLLRMYWRQASQHGSSGIQVACPQHAQQPYLHHMGCCPAD